MQTKKILIAILVLFCSMPGKAEDYFRISSVGASLNEAFDGFSGTYGSLSNGFSIYKDSGSVMTNDDPDFRGLSAGGVTVGGCYAWRIPPNGMVLGFQPTDTKFTPGYVDLLATNASGIELFTLTVSFDFVYLNNADRSTSIRLDYSVAGGPLCNATVITNQTPLLRDASAVWACTNLTSVMRLSAPVPKGSFFKLRWTFDDAGGSGSRDECGLDNVRLTVDTQHGTVFYIY